jgi:hypothetical protein
VRPLHAKQLDSLEGIARFVPDELAVLAQAVNLQFQVGHVGQQ